ncbi:SAM-dependent methyltransferase [Candidatus Microgenomates bacterium]|nr:SAM-dependent methyltransferase [Candidatus Microgenomates bacterium]
MKASEKIKPISSSFRDPSGTVFYQDGLIYRTVNFEYKEYYDHLINSGLYDQLVKLKYLIPHKEIKIRKKDKDIYKIIKPQKIPFISYPYEWTFSQLKDAALLTLAIQKLSLKHDMSLKDGSGFNIQFVDGKPILIDTLSFEKYQKDKPWKAYGQFCRLFLSPLALMVYQDATLGRLLRLYLDGIPLEIASKLLPPSSYLNLSILVHIHLHARSSRYYADKPESGKQARLSKVTLAGIIENLNSAINNLKWKLKKTEWSDYYHFSNYSSSAFEHKERIFKHFLKIAKVKNMWDMGANTGHFSKIAESFGIRTIAFDSDIAAIEQLYLDCKNANRKLILPLFVDITNPSPSIGWESRERLSMIDRGYTPLVSALALIHHLSIGQNIPFENLSNFFQKICRWLINEFIPKEDSQIKKMLINRRDIFTLYTQTNFEKVFSEQFILCKKTKLKDSLRVMYLFKQ